MFKIPKAGRFRFCGAVGGVFVVILIVIVMLNSTPIGFYDLAQDARGGIFGGSTSRVRFFRGQVIELYSGGTEGVYFRTNGQWIWRRPSGREFVISPGVASLGCIDRTHPTNAFTLRRVLPSRLKVPVEIE